MATYSIANDTLNGVVDAGSLGEEISSSSIKVAYDNIITGGDVLTINFKSSLDTDDQTTLDSVVANHDGEPIVETEEVKLYGQEYDASGNVVQRSIPQKTQEKTYSRATHDYCLKTTWYSDSVRVTDEVLTTSDNLTFSCVNDTFIDVVNGVINRQDLHQQYAIEVKVDDVVVTSGFTIDHENAEIVFDSSQAGSVVKCSYSHPTTSQWRLPVPAGKLLIIEHSEVQFTTDVEVTSPLKFEVWVDNPFFAVVGHPLEGIPRIPGETIQYNSIRDIINESNLGFNVPSMSGIGSPLIIFPFNYVGEKVLDSAMNAELVVSCVNDVELPGSYGTATFYLIERDVAQ